MEDLSNLMAVYEKLGFLVDEQVIREYIHHADVAEDVAAYLDLYRKYQDDYGIPQILDGCRQTGDLRAHLCGGVDERLSVVHLLLDGLAAFFGRAASERALTDAWYAFLKSTAARWRQPQIRRNVTGRLSQSGSRRCCGRLQMTLTPARRQSGRSFYWKIKSGAAGSDKRFGTEQF